MEERRFLDPTVREPDAARGPAATAEWFDDDLLSYVRDRISRTSHSLGRQVAARENLLPGRGLALVLEGSPLFDAIEGAWDFGSSSSPNWPVPMVDGDKLSLGGRIRWFKTFEPNPDGTYTWFDDAPWPDDAWSALIKNYLDGDHRRVVLLDETFNRDGRSNTEMTMGFVTYRGEVMQLLKPGATLKQIEAASDVANHCWDLWSGVLSSLADASQLTNGTEISDALFEVLVDSAEALTVNDFDGTGFLVWALGDTPPAWTEIP